MAMFRSKSDGENKSRTLFGFLGATLSMEMGMAGISNHGFFIIPKALKKSQPRKIV